MTAKQLEEWEQSFDSILKSGARDSIAILESRMDCVATLAKNGYLPAYFEFAARRVETRCNIILNETNS